MDQQVFRQGKLTLTLTASQKVAIMTDGKATFSKIAGPAQARLSEPVFIATVTAGVPYLSSAFSAGDMVTIESVSEAPVYVNVGLTPSTLKGSSGLYQPVPGTLDATGTLTAALLEGRIVTSSTAAATVATVDTGAVMDAALSMAIGDSFDWTIINTGPSTFTVTAAASGHTLVGVGAVLTLISSQWRTKKTAAATFVSYRLT